MGFIFAQRLSLCPGAAEARFTTVNPLNEKKRTALCTESDALDGGRGRDCRHKYVVLRTLCPDMAAKVELVPGNGGIRCSHDYVALVPLMLVANTPSLRPPEMPKVVTKTFMSMTK